MAIHVLEEALSSRHATGD